MKTHTKKFIAFLLMVLMTLNSAIPAVAATGDNSAALGSLADSYETQEGTFTLTTSSRFYVASDSAPAGELLQTVQLIQRQFAADGKPSSAVLDVVWGPVAWAKAGDIVLYVSSASGLAAEAYQLDVTDRAIVTASDVDGLLYGANMLQKYLRAEGGNTLSGFKVSDAPDTIERTVHLDCGRKYYTKEWVCNFIKEMSWMGYNALELHFSEDGGFRADFWDSAYYEGVFQPENDFTWLCGSQPASWVLSAYKNDADENKYLTTAELVEICKTAAEYHIDIIPSFDSPAHMDYITWKFEQYVESKGGRYTFTFNQKEYTFTDACINYTNYTGTDSEATWPNYSAINITDLLAKNFVFALYTDIANFFKQYAGSTEFSIGADEVNLTYTKTWTYADFPTYVNDLDDMLNGLGYTTRIFNDFIGTDNDSYTSGSGVSLDSFNSDIEILFWNSPFNPMTGKYQDVSENVVLSVNDFVNNGRTLYNVIQTATYYCTRVTGSNWTYANKDARDPANRQWQVFYATEDRIYDHWYPGDFGEKGDYKETVTVTESQIAGAYFCIWHDFASMNTESEIWNGAKDKNNSNVYYLLDRMWSNTIKMWNWDINSTVDFDTYATIRNRFGYFPGYTSCSAAASLPASTDPSQAYQADHSALEAVIADKILQGSYSDESYAAYEEAYNAAVALNADHSATADQIQVAIDRLKAAEAGLAVNQTLAVKFKTTVNGEEKTIQAPWGFTITTDSFRIYIPPMNGYTLDRVEGAKFQPLPSGDGSGYIVGKMNSGTVTIWYTSTPNMNRLKELIGYGIDNNNGYTAATWTAYTAALAAANNAASGSAEISMQSEVDSLVNALMQAQTELTMDLAVGKVTQFISVEKLTATARLGKQVGLRITTSPDVQTLAIEGKDMNLCVGKVQILNTGEVVKIWLIHFDADQVGEFTYTIQANGTQDISTTVDISVK